MAQTGFTPLLVYSSSTATNAPTAGNLLNNATGSELAINIADGKLFYKDSANAVQVIGWKIRPATAGGTGLTSFAVGDLIYADTTTTLAKLADVATGNALISGGVGAAPSYGKIGLTTHVSGTLPVANGGTGLTTLTAGYIPYGNGTGAISSSGNFFFDGTNLGLGTSTPSTGAMNRQLTISSGASNLAGVILVNNATGTAFNNGFQIYANALDAALFNQSNGILAFGTNQTERMRISAAGGVSIGNTTDPGAGNLRFNTTNTNGIYFGSSSLLADYEEGNCSFTVTSTGGTITTASSSAKYTKIGRTVFISGSITITNNGTGTGALNIAGLPYTPTQAASGVGRETVNTGSTCSFTISNGSTAMQVYTYNNLYPALSGSVIQFSVLYTA